VDYLPDHPHEGNCRVPDPDDAGTTVDVDGEGTPRAEWPLGSGGRPFPTVVATAHVSQHVTASPLADLPYLPPVKPQTEATDYPVICAYDGHQARVGRVAVDATWHHFFNVNVNQMAGARVGEAGYAEWLDITQYYWNLARWLAPVELHEELIIENLLQAIEAAQILEDPRFNQPGNEIGQRVREALQHAIRDAGPCLIIDTVIGVLRHHIDIHLPDPWWSLTLPPKLLPDPDPRPRNTPGRLTPDIRVWDPIVLVESALTEATAAAVFEVTKLDSDPKVHDPDALRSAIISGLIDGVIAYSRAIRIAYESAAASAVHLDQDLAARGRRPDDD
jgi:hypothetical protein